MNQNALDYLKQNKDKYEKEALIEQLRKNDYSENDINESVFSVYGAENNGAVQSISPAPINFFDFKTRKFYTNSSEKWKDFLFGFFAPWLLGLVAAIPFLGFPIALLALPAEIVATVMLFNRRRFISYGLISHFAVGLLFLIIVVAFLSFLKF